MRPTQPTAILRHPFRLHRSALVRCALPVVAVALVLAGCTSSQVYKKAEAAARSDDWDAAVAYYQTALADHPDRLEYEIKLERAKLNASRQHRTMARTLYEDGDVRNAVLEYQLALQLNAHDEVVQSELSNALEALADVDAERARPTPLEELMLEAERTVLELPRLQPKVENLSLWFPSAPLKSIYRSLARTAGLNVVFDPDVKDVPTSFELSEEMPFQKVIALLSRAHGHFVKAISAETFIVVADTADKRAQYADEVMRTFFLSNGQVQEVAQLLRSVLESNGITENTATNSITVRERPEVMALAAQLISTADKSAGEVLLEIEVMEVDRRTLREYGVSLSSYEITQRLAQGEGGISLNSLRNVDATNWFFTIPSVRYKLFKETGDFKLVANPQLRVQEGQQASLLIGQEVPIVITQFSPSQFVGAQVVPIQTTDYRKVGISMNIGARVHHNNEVTLNLDFEISSISAQIGVQDLPIFITRELSTTTRLRDGETSVLAGLLRDDERVGVIGVPGLSDIPIIGKLFSSTRTEIEQVDVILTITPHLLRTADIRRADLQLNYLGRDIGIGEGLLTRVSGETTAVFPTSETVVREPLADSRPRDGIAANPIAGPALALVPARESVTVGEPFDVELRLEDVGDLMSAGVGLRYDSQRLEFIGGTEGSFFSADGSQTTFQAQLTSPGILGIAVTRLGNATGAVGSGTVARLTFRAIAEGEATVVFNTVALRKVDGQSLKANFRPARLRISR